MNWKKKREEMRECIKGLERRVEELERARRGELKGRVLKEGERGGRGMIENRLLEIEWKIELREREER